MFQNPLESDDKGIFSLLFLYGVSGYRTVYAAETTEQKRIYDFPESISVNVEISDEGIVSEKR